MATLSAGSPRPLLLRGRGELCPGWPWSTHHVPRAARPRTGPEGRGGAGSRKHFLMFAEGRVRKEDICSKGCAGRGGGGWGPRQALSWGSEKPPMSMTFLGDVVASTNRQEAHRPGRSPQPRIWGDRPNADQKAGPTSSWELARGCDPRSPGLERVASSPGGPLSFRGSEQWVPGSPSAGEGWLGRRGGPCGRGAGRSREAAATLMRSAGEGG